MLSAQERHIYSFKKNSALLIRIFLDFYRTYAARTYNAPVNKVT